MSKKYDDYKEMIDELQNNGLKICKIVCSKIGNSPLDVIAKKMGYSNSKKGIARIEFTINDQYLGLLESNFDGLYSSALFLDKLLEVIELDDPKVNEYIKEINIERLDKDFGFRPWIFMQTHFKRSGQPIFYLACCEGRRRLYLTKKLKKLSREGKIKYVRQVIKKHQAETNGLLDLWGTVAEYVCHFEKSQTTTFLPDGTIISETNEEVGHSAACLKVGNKVLVGIEPGTENRG